MGRNFGLFTRSLRLRTLSFNWRLIMAPAHVLKYLVAHEAAHLAVPDHSRKFWLTVQSVCPETERAKQWLSRHGHSLLSGFTSDGPDLLTPHASKSLASRRTPAAAPVGQKSAR
ncbi:MAG: M48 family metallopeptidase [Pyrinomonadaceae bacterium]